MTPDPAPQPADSFRPGEPPRAHPDEQIILHPPPRPAGLGVASAQEASIAKGAAQPQMKDGFREVVETIVFVVVLVLLLKTFLAEAFVIPTGSMATTLLGYHRDSRCDQCGYTYPVNCSQEVEPQQGQPVVPVLGSVCPNCQRENEFPQANRR